MRYSMQIHSETIAQIMGWFFFAFFFQISSENSTIGMRKF